MKYKILNLIPFLLGMFVQFMLLRSIYEGPSLMTFYFFNFPVFQFASLNAQDKGTSFKDAVSTVAHKKNGSGQL